MAAALPAVFAGCAAAGPVRWPSGAAAGPRANCGASGAAVATAGSAVAARTSPRRPRAATSTVITRAHFGFILAIAAVGLLAQATTLLVSLIEATATAATLALAGRKFGRLQRCRAAVLQPTYSSGKATRWPAKS